MGCKYEIRDWANNLMKYKDRANIFDSFDEAEDFLSDYLGDNYETDRQEYYIVERAWE